MFLQNLTYRNIMEEILEIKKNLLNIYYYAILKYTVYCVLQVYVILGNTVKPNTCNMHCRQ